MTLVSCFPLQSPIADYTLPIKTLKTWFEEIVVTRKREELAKLLTILVDKTKGNKTINLPTLMFPTKDGKLKTKAEAQADAKVSKADGEKKKAAESSDSQPSATATDDAQSNSEAATKTQTPGTPPQPTSTTDDGMTGNKEEASPKTGK